MQYIISAIVLLLVTGIFLLLKKFKADSINKFEKIVSLCFVAIFVIRYLSFRNLQTIRDYFIVFESFGGYQNEYLNFIGNICNWFEITAAIFIFLRPFFRFKTSIWYVKYFSISTYLVCFIALYPMISMVQGNYGMSFMSILLAIEVGAGLGISIHYHLKDLHHHISGHSYVEVGIAVTFFNLATMPIYMPSFFFAQPNLKRLFELFENIESCDDIFNKSPLPSFRKILTQKTVFKSGYYN